MVAGPFREGHKAEGCMWLSQARGRVTALPWRVARSCRMLLGTRSFWSVWPSHSPRVLLAACLSAFLPASPCPRPVCRSAQPPVFPVH